MDDDGGNLGPINIPLLKFCRSVATGLTALTLVSRYTTFPGGEPWLALLPNLKCLIVTDHVKGDQVPEPWDENEGNLAERSPVQLERWLLSGGCLPDPTFRPIPKLTSLKLLDTVVPCISLLLRACAPSLRELWLVGTNPNSYEPDQPLPLATIILPALRSAHVGLDNSPLWTDSADFNAYFVIKTPALERVSWGRTPEPDEFVEDRGGGVDDEDAFELDALDEVVAGCSKLQRVDFDGSGLDPQDLAGLWGSAVAGLKEVILGDRATAAGLDRLGRALPQLELVGATMPPASWTALAQMAAVLQQSREEAGLHDPLRIQLTGKPLFADAAAELARLSDQVVHAIQRLQARITEMGGEAAVPLAPFLRLEGGERWPAEYLCARGGLLEGYADEVAGMVEVAEPLEDDGPEGWGRGALAVNLRERAEEALEEWLGARMEVDAREWLKGQDWVVLEWE